MIRSLGTKPALVRIPNGAKDVYFKSCVILSSSKSLRRKKVFAIVRTPNGEPHGDFLTILKNLVRDEDGDIIFFDPQEKREPWYGLALALDDSDIDQGREKRNFRFGLVEVDVVSLLNQGQLLLNVTTKRIDFRD